MPVPHQPRSRRAALVAGALVGLLGLTATAAAISQAPWGQGTHSKQSVSAAGDVSAENGASPGHGASSGGTLSGSGTLSGGGTASGSGSTHQAAHFNTGAAHSPQLLSTFSATSGTATTSSAISGAVQGIDVASFQEQGGIDWAGVASSGKQFAAIKVTEGDYYQNKYALSDLAKAKAAGLATVAYAFAIPNGGGSSSSPVTQADDAINFLKSGSAGVSPIMLDIEYDPYKSSDGTNDCYGLTQSAMGTWVKSFAAEVQTKTGRPAIIYTTTNWWNTCVGTTVSLGSNPLWIAHYTTSTSPGTLPDGWSSGQWTYWQYADNGSIPLTGGGSVTTDLDQLNPGLLTLLNPGDEQDAAGSSQITPVQLHASQSVTYSSDNLPPGLSLSSAGLITGTPPGTPGSVQVTVTATPASGTPASVTFTWYWSGTLSVTSPGNQSTSGGGPVSLQAQASDSVNAPPVTFSAPALPPGMFMSTAGRIAGWADKPGTYKVTVYAADALESAGKVTFTWTVSLAPGTGPTGAVPLALGGMCLNAGSTTAGSPVSIWTCNGSAAQQWTYAQDDTLRINNECLTSPTQADTDVTLQACTGFAVQQWQLAYPRSVNPTANVENLTLYNPGSGMCLDDPGSSTTNGTKQVVWFCDGNQKEEWKLPRGPIQSGIPGLCVDDSGNLTANGSKIDISTCVAGSTAQIWGPKLDGTVRIHAKCLDVHGGGTASGTLVDLYTCNGTAAQQWHLVADGGGVMLKNPQSGLCLADPGGSTTSGTQLEIMSCKSTYPSRFWRAS
jgi:GH25 family lysozyme M1 (1,4-beta-N-acetylmuramidase)